MTGPTATPGVAQCRTCGDQISEADIRRSATAAGAKSCANVSCSVDRNGPTDPDQPHGTVRFYEDCFVNGYRSSIGMTSWRYLCVAEPVKQWREGADAS